MGVPFVSSPIFETIPLLRTFKAPKNPNVLAVLFMSGRELPKVDAVTGKLILWGPFWRSISTVSICPLFGHPLGGDVEEFSGTLCCLAAGCFWMDCTPPKLVLLGNPTYHQTKAAKQAAGKDSLTVRPIPHPSWESNGRERMAAGEQLLMMFEFDVFLLV